MAKDIDLMAKNAKTYNEPGSQVFKVSVSLKQELVKVWSPFLLRLSENNLSLFCTRMQMQSRKSLFKKRLNLNKQSPQRPVFA